MKARMSRACMRGWSLMRGPRLSPARQEIIRRSQISHLIPFYVYGAPGSVKAGVIKA